VSETRRHPFDELVDLYAGPDAQALYDEVVTDLDHALQAAQIAADHGASDALVAAALLHDVGHFVVRDALPTTVELTHDLHHERAGATYLRRWFGSEVTEPVRLHVAAKRYLCATDPGYLGELSASSIRSLRVQGGPMTADEVAAFEAEPHHRAAVELRIWDDLAKIPELPVADFVAYLPLLERLRDHV
jgi:gamma-butyrobetaine dioxygenase